MSVTIVQPKSKTSKWVKRGLLVGTGLSVAAFIGGVMSAENVVRHVAVSNGIFPPDETSDASPSKTKGDSDSNDAEAVVNSSPDSFQKNILDAVREHVDANEAAKAEKRKARKSYLDQANDSLVDALIDYVGDKLAPSSDDEPLIKPLVQRAKRWARDRVFDLGFYGAAVVMTVRDAGRDSYRDFAANLANELEKSLRYDAVDASPQPGDVMSSDGVFMSGLCDSNGRSTSSASSSSNN